MPPAPTPQNAQSGQPQPSPQAPQTPQNWQPQPWQQQSWQPQPIGEPVITAATPRGLADEIVRRRANACYRWSVVGAGLFALFSVFVWMSILSPGQDLLVSVLGEAGAWLIGLCGMIAVIGLGISVYRTFQVLRDRAMYAQPLLSRTATDIRTMHMWPVRNINGSLVALAETGAAAVRGPGRFVWYLTCVLWPLAAGWFIAADVSRTYFQAGIITVLAFSATAVTARLLNYVLAPEEVHRHIPVGTGREQLEPGFWAKGFIPSEVDAAQGVSGAGAVGKQLFEGTAGNFVDEYYK